MIYYVFELQSGTTSGAAIHMAYDNLKDAQNKYYTTLAAAVGTDVRKHGAMLVNEDGFVIESKIFEHEPVPVVPEYVEPEEPETPVGE